MSQSSTVFRAAVNPLQRQEQSLLWVDEVPIVPRAAENGKDVAINFILETGKTRPSDTVSRRIIRAHATRSSIEERRKRAQDGDQWLDVVVAPRKKGSAAQIKRARNSTKSSSEQESEPTRRDFISEFIVLNAAQSRPLTGESLLPAHVRTGFLDPFHTLPVQATPQIQKMLSHWVKNMMTTTKVLTPRESWLPTAIKDPAHMHGALFLIASNLYPRDDSITTVSSILYHKGEAIRLVNSRLMDKSKPLTDATIVTVAALAHGESYIGTRESAVAHINGLDHMVQTRGGIMAISPGIIRKYISWVDLTAATSLDTLPRFPCVNSVPFEFTESSGMTIHPSLIHLTSSASTHQESVATLYRGLRYLTKILDLDPNMGPVVEQVDFSDKNEYLERESIILAHATAAPKNDTDSWDRVHIIIMLYALSVNLYNYLILRYGVPTLLTTKVVRRILAGLDKLDLEAELEQYPQLMFWVVALSAMASADAGDRYFLMQRVRGICEDRKIKTADGLEWELGSLIWPKRFEVPQFEILCKNVFEPRLRTVSR